MMEAVALFDYNGRTNKELSFRTNQIIYIYKKLNQQWWLGHIAGKYQSGFIPDSYIKLKSKLVSYNDSIQDLPPISLTPNLSSSLPSTIDHDHSSSHLTSIIDINTVLHKVLSKEYQAQYFHSKSSSLSQDIDAPDLVLNLPISLKSLDENIPIVHSTIIIDFDQPKIPSPSSILKKSEKPMQFIERLGLQQQSISICRSSKTTDV